MMTIIMITRINKIITIIMITIIMITRINTNYYYNNDNNNNDCNNKHKLLL